MRCRFAAPPPPSSTPLPLLLPPADPKAVELAADRFELDDPAGAGAGIGGPAGASVAAVRPGVEHAGGSARDRDLVPLVAILIATVGAAGTGFN